MNWTMIFEFAMCFVIGGVILGVLTYFIYTLACKYQERVIDKITKNIIRKYMPAVRDLATGVTEDFIGKMPDWTTKMIKSFSEIEGAMKDTTSGGFSGF